MVAPTPAERSLTREGKARLWSKPRNFQYLSCTNCGRSSRTTSRHELALAIKRSCAQGPDLSSMREWQATLLLQIKSSSLRSAMPATTIEHFVALLDVTLEHELDLAPDIASYGSPDCPMTARLLRALRAHGAGIRIPELVVTGPGRTANRQCGAPRSQKRTTSQPNLTDLTSDRERPNTCRPLQNRTPRP